MNDLLIDSETAVEVVAGAIETCRAEINSGFEAARKATKGRVAVTPQGIRSTRALRGWSNEATADALVLHLEKRMAVSVGEARAQQLIAQCVATSDGVGGVGIKGGGLTENE